MSDSSNSLSVNNPVGDPLLNNAINVDRFKVDIDYVKYFYPAAGHRPLIRQLVITNQSWTGDADELVVSVRVVASTGQDLTFPTVRAYRSIPVRDQVSFEVSQIKPNLRAIADLEEADPAHILVQVKAEEVIISEHRFAIDFLCYDQWMHSKIDYGTLAAFIFPNHPVVSQIMIGVRDRLFKETGDGATDGYQRFNPDYFEQSFPIVRSRVNQVLKAIFEELQAQNFEYSDPPAAFEGYGQKIRTPEVIAEQRVATCLDSTLLAASCMAAAGLNPLVFVVQDHAFPGACVIPLNLKDAVVENPNIFQDLVAKSFIASFESTMICRSIKEPFNAAVNRHQDYATSDIEDFRALVNTEMASISGIRRLPSRSALKNGEIVDIESVDPQPPEDRVSEPEDINEDPNKPKLDKGNIPPRVRRWMDALLDISNSNPLINLKSTPVFLATKAANKAAINIPVTGEMLALIEDAISGGNAVKLLAIHNMPGNLIADPSFENQITEFNSSKRLAIGPMQDFQRSVEGQAAHWVKEEGAPPGPARDKAFQLFGKEHEKEVARRFRNLKSTADAVEAQSATNQLFLTIGTMVWETPGDGNRAGQVVRSPLFVIPVRISGSAANLFNLVAEESAEISPNYCLMEKLRSELKLTFEDLETPDLDDAGIDVKNAISSIRKQLSASKHASVRIEEECNLAVLDFATFRMWKDIQTNWESFQNNPVVKHLISSSNSTLQQNTVPYTDEILTPFDCDESQVNAVRWSLEGQSFVLEGPPGTGKSQTIANMIAANMSEGRRVLFVAEKKVALEGVAKKLREIGLDPFCITMHHESTTPDSIRAQLKASLDFIGEDLSGQWESETAQVGAIGERLNRYRDSLVSKNEVGQNALSAHREVVRLGTGNSIDVDPTTLGKIGGNIDKIRPALLDLPGIVGSSRININAEWSIASLEDGGQINRTDLANALSDLARQLSDCTPLRPLIEPLLTYGITSLGVDAVNAIKLLTSSQTIDYVTAQEISSSAWSEKIDRAVAMVDALRTEHGIVFSFFDPSAFAMDLSAQINAANEAISAGIISRKRSLERLKSLVQPVAQQPVTQTAAEILTLLQRIKPANEGLSRLRESFVAIPHINLRPDFNPLVAQHVQEAVEKASSLKNQAAILLMPAADNIRQLTSAGYQFSPNDIERVEDFLSTWAQLLRIFEFNADSQTRWLNGRSVWDAVTTALPIWSSDSPLFHELSRIALVHKTLAPLREGGQDQLVNDLLDGKIDLDDLYKDFELGLAKASLSDRLNQGALQTFERLSFERSVGEFVRRDLSRKELMKTVIPYRLSESRPFKYGVVTGEIGSLVRELGRKVRRVSIPKLMKEHGETVTRLTPCFLMSPDAVSRLLPGDSQFFDMVIFDEASQIRVAAAIPAMGRAKSVVIVGDSQQMPPSRRIGAKTSDGDDDAEDTYLDLESILTECTESNLPSLMLKCHFRSQHEALIAFSNRNFYNGDLVTFPAPDTALNMPVYWFDVPDGQFHRSGDFRHTNPNEALAVVNEIVRRVNDPIHSSKSIGVVTFNETQAELIISLLLERRTTDAALDKVLNITDENKALFVVALERVQGDERDSIFLSVSYSYQSDSRDKVPTNWGPLVNRGGERRLNVAITRAKQDMMVFCSFNPDHVKSTSTFKGIPTTVSFLQEVRNANLSGSAELGAREVKARDTLRRKMFDQLRDAGFKVRENVGLSKFRIDISIANDDNREFLALLIDSDDWANRSTAYDREVLPNSVMRLIGWRRVGRVWTKTVAEDPEFVLKAVKAEVEREELRQQLIRDLTERGYETRTDTQLSRMGVDLALRRPGQARWPLAVVITGDNLFQQFYSYDGERPSDELLERADCMSAHVVRMGEFALSPEAAIEKIESIIEDRSQELDRRGLTEALSKQSIRGAAPEIEVVAPPQQTGLALSDHKETFNNAKNLPIAGTSEQLGPGPLTNHALIRKAATEIVETEGPILEGRLGSILVARFGLGTLRAARLKALITYFTSLHQTTDENGIVYWPSDKDPKTWKGFRPNDNESRPLDQVPHHELVNAVLAFVEMGGSAFTEEVCRAVSGVYGRHALTKVVETKLTQVIDWCVERNKLVREGDLVRLAEDR